MCVVILPNGLFENNTLLEDFPSKVYIVEHPEFFTKYKYHKLKLILHRATMKMYFDFITKKYKVRPTYIEFTNYKEFTKTLPKQDIHMHDPTNHNIMREYAKYTKHITFHDTPLFLTTPDELDSANNITTDSNHLTFYVWQRKRLDILMDKNKPVGGKWTCDKENRQPFPHDITEDDPKINKSKYINDATTYISKHFKNNIGDTNFYYPITFAAVRKQTDEFIKNKLKLFGKYQDAVNKDIIFGYHSVLSPFLNIGLITPKYVVDKVMSYYEKNESDLSSIEGFIRQIIGWREYVRMMYHYHNNELTNSNYLNNTRKLDPSWYDNTPHPMPFITDMKNKVIKYGYLHHIERLMYVGNIMLLSEIEPGDVYEWFQTCFIDSYEWVMSPNIYGMSQYSAGAIMMKRPYFSSSNYISKMSNYKKHDLIKIGSEQYKWQEIMDALYYNFINRHRKKFEKNYSLANSVKYLEKMDTDKKKKILYLAKKYLTMY